MPGSDASTHPTPAQVYASAVAHAALLRAIFNHPEFKYLEPPTALICKMDTARTPAPLLWVADFVQKTYIGYVVPFLPAGATRKCRDIANPWAYADPAARWEYTWDPAGDGALKDADGNVVPFPRLPEAQAFDKLSDTVGRDFMAKKLILENGTDVKARLMLGGQTFDFGEEVRAAAAKLD
ncbi:hypothetical protein F5X96DRAFT_124553 [Biscogniauxia mediterranea]|nr:hypothetical protein F5X96DRAFT_124553 [Biscogniauxia mediterranea]